MNKMSTEQHEVFDNIKNGLNVVVDACAGSGKSTTILSIAKELPNKKLLQFTYNAMLRHEVKDKINELKLSNIQVHTYHSFAVKYYSSIGHTDTGIRKIIYSDIRPRQEIEKVDILVLDESQDMTFLYFQLIVKISRDMNNKFQLLVLGDYMQGLYEFKGADIRFLTKADEIWSTLPFLSSQDFKKCTLRVSYRITNQMASFINTDMLGENRLSAIREGSPVIYIRRPRYQIEQIVVYQIRRLLAEGESPSDFFVLGASVKGVNSNIRRMENALTENNIPCHVPMFETESGDERVIEGKVVFSTFHTVKGRQRKYVFIVGFDQGYFYNARDIKKDVCPNTLYVGTTRATHGLYLLENDSSHPLEFLKRGHHEMKQSDYIDFKGMPQSIFHSTQDAESQNGIVLIPTYRTTATSLIQFISETVIADISPILDRIFIMESDIVSEIDIPKIVETRDGLYEDISDLNGIAIPSIYYDYMESKSDIAKTKPKKQTGADILKKMIEENVKEIHSNSHGFLKRAIKYIADECITPADYLYLANVYVATQEKLYFKLKQIDRDEYGWITNDMIEKCKVRLDSTIGQEYNSGQIEIEKLLIHHSQEEIQSAKIDSILYPYFGNEVRFRFTVRVDLITKSTLWELKCTSQITMEHKIQVVIYAWLWRVLYSEEKEFKIMNIRTGEILRLDTSLDDLTTLMVAILRGKYGKQVVLADGDFITNCREYVLADTIFC